MRILAIDFGTKRIGIACSDPTETLASPVATIPNDEDAIPAIGEMTNQDQVGLVVLGFPLNAAGKEGVSAGLVRDFMASLQHEIAPITVELLDERFTTVSAGRALAEAGKDSKKSRVAIDQTAAAILLQAYLDRSR